MIKHKFKPGDQVMIYQYGHGFSPGECGQVVTISAINGDYMTNEPGYYICEPYGNNKFDVDKTVGETSFIKPYSPELYGVSTFGEYDDASIITKPSITTRVEPETKTERPTGSPKSITRTMIREMLREMYQMGITDGQLMRSKAFGDGVLDDIINKHIEGNGDK